jgi:conjugal transfer pilus assembly protein TraF
MAPYVQTRDQQQRQSAISEIAREYGPFYFYRGSNPIDVQMAGVVADFAKRNHTSLTPVTIDGQMASSVPESWRDAGQSKDMNVNALLPPGLDIVNRSLWPESSGRCCRRGEFGERKLLYVKPDSALSLSVNSLK